MAGVIDGAERFFDGMGLMTGDYAVPKRAVIGLLVGGFLVTYFKPALMFEGGQPRQWSLLQTQGDASTPTAVPWWSLPLAGAVIAAVLV
jgi:hypothetical protein